MKGAPDFHESIYRKTKKSSNLNCWSVALGYQNTTKLSRWQYLGPRWWRVGCWPNSPSCLYVKQYSLIINQSTKVTKTFNAPLFPISHGSFACRHDMDTRSALLSLCEENSCLITVENAIQLPVNYALTSTHLQHFCFTWHTAGIQKCLLQWNLSTTTTSIKKIYYLWLIQ